MSWFPRAFAIVAVILFFGIPSRAQVRSNIAAVNLNAILRDGISVSASPGLVNFALPANGVVNGNATVTITTAWVLRRRERIRTFAYFSTAAAALTNGAGSNIPSSSVSGSVNGGAFQPFTGRCRFSANTCVRVFRTPGRVRRRGTNTSSLQLRINTVGLRLPAGTYTGVLNIRAVAF